MGDSLIEWCDRTWPIVQGCDYMSPGCTHCYAVLLLWRLAHNPNPKVSGPLQGLVAKGANGKLHFTGKLALREDRMQDPFSWREPSMVFVPSHGDIFHKDVPWEFLERIYASMALNPRHTFQVLTKRADRMHQFLTYKHTPARVTGAMFDIAKERGKELTMESHPHLFMRGHATNPVPWPLPNVWQGISTEDQRRFGERWGFLRDSPATLRFISYEPALSELQTDYCNGWFFEDALRGIQYHDAPEGVHSATRQVPKIDWVIAGGESGGNFARDFDLQWARSIARQCASAGTPLFIKQMGRHPVDGALVTEGDSPAVGMKHRKGADIKEWPAELRIQQFPAGFTVRKAKADA